ncbi:MAG: TetR family transcriptional regulator [Sphingobacteriaceae bacterium]
MEIQQRVLLKADELFRTYGIRGVTMDDIAKALGISKKTLYQSYSDKDLLIQETVEMTISNHYNGILSCKGSAAENAIHEQFAINELLGKMMHGINPIMFYDLQKYYPSIWNKFSEFRNTKVLAEIQDNISRGIKEGLYRNDFDVLVQSKMRLAEIDSCFKYDVFPPSSFSIVQVMKQSTEMFMYGMVTLKGYKLINQYKNITE